MSVQEEIQGGGMEGGGQEEEDLGGGLKRARDRDQNTEQADTQGGCSKRRRMRSENWSAKETLQMIELRKAIVQASIAKGNAAWEQIAKELAHKNPDSQARSGKQVAQRWDTLVKVYVSVEEECCGTGKSVGEVIGERQKRGKTETYRQSWHELIALGNPGKRRAPGKTAVQADGALIGTGNGASKALTTSNQKFRKIANQFIEILDIIDRSFCSSEGNNAVLGQNIVSGSNWEPDDDQGLVTTISVSGVKKPDDDMKAEVARATQSMADTMQSISKAVSTSESFCLEVDQTDWSMVIQRLSEISQKSQAISVRGIREEVGADEWIPNSQQQPVSAARSGDNHTEIVSLMPSFHLPEILARTSLSSLNTKRLENSWSRGKRYGDSTASPESSSSTFAELQDITDLPLKSDGESLCRANLSNLFPTSIPRGMDWLHNNNVHRDLKASNLLVRKVSNGKFGCFVADYDYECSIGVTAREVSAARSGDNHTRSSIRRSVSLTSTLYLPKICTRTSMSSLNTKRLENSCSPRKRNGDSTASPESSSSTFGGLQDIMHLSPKSDGESLCRANSSNLFPTTSVHSNTGTTSVMEEGLLFKPLRKWQGVVEATREKGSRSTIQTRTRFGPRA